MTTASISRIIGLSMAMAAVSSGAEPPPQCNKLAQDVFESATKDPSKVLMIVEDALVIEEACACEIVKAAINAVKADPPMVKQIVETAVAVAPKMTPVIVECANSSAPGATGVETVASHSGKDAKNVQPVTVQPPDDTAKDYSAISSSIRGVYLMAPAVGGFIATESESDEKEKRHYKDDEDDDDDDHPRDDKPKPMSPSQSSPH